MAYLDFDLEIGARKGYGYPVAVLNSPAGTARAIMHFSYSREQVDKRLRDLTNSLQSSSGLTGQEIYTHLQLVQKIGLEFFKALFAGEIRIKYDLSKQIAQHEGKVLRVQLKIKTGEITSQPWIFLFPRDPDGYFNYDRVLFHVEEVETTGPQLVINNWNGPYINGDVDTGGGDFVGRDQAVQTAHPDSQPAVNERNQLPKISSKSPYLYGLGGLFVVLVVFLVIYLISRNNLLAGFQPTAVAGTGVAQLPATPTPSPTITQTHTSTPTVTPTLTFTPTPTPLPQVLLQRLIEQEGQAVVDQKIQLIEAIFRTDALRIDGATGKSENAIEWYRKNFDPKTPNRLIFTRSIHENYHFNMQSQTAVVTNDSCGHFNQNNVPSDYTSFQSDQWVFELDAQGRWWVKEFTYNKPLPDSVITFSFEEGQNQCVPWAERYYDKAAMGYPPEIIQGQGLGYQSQGALRFGFNAETNKFKSGQVIVYNLPFAGHASAYIYTPPDAPDSLEAGFMAQEFAEPPYKEHRPTSYVALLPGQWTFVTWDVSKEIKAQNWHIDSLHFIGIEIHDKKGAYKGSVLIDDVTIKLH